MLDLSRKLVNELVLDDEVYPLDLSFGNILVLFDMLHDEDVMDLVKPYLALRILLDTRKVEYRQRVKDFVASLSIEEAMEIFEAIQTEHISPPNPLDEVEEYDLAGNLLTKKPKTQDGEEAIGKAPSFSLKYDGDYIYSSFLQAYGIDLLEVQDSLHWLKFNALINGLPDNTKLMQVMQIRNWKPQDGDKADHISKMRRLQEQYALPSSVEY